MKVKDLFDDYKRLSVLRNEEGELSLWRPDLSVPPGWERVLDEADRTACDEFIELHAVERGALRRSVADAR